MLRLLPETSSDKIEALNKLIDTEKGKAIGSIKPITEKMNQMAEKTMNASIIAESKPISLRKLFSTIRSACDDNVNLNFVYENHWGKETLNKSIISNLYLLTYILDEIMINLEKHSTGECQICFIENETPKITFKNTVKNLERNRNIINKIIDDFNQDNVNEIMKRNSNGLRIIKQYLTQLNIGHRMNLINDILVLNLTLKLEDESFNI